MIQHELVRAAGSEHGSAYSECRFAADGDGITELGCEFVSRGF